MHPEKKQNISAYFDFSATAIYSNYEYRTWKSLTEQQKKRIIHTDGISWYTSDNYYLDLYDQQNVERLKAMKQEAGFWLRHKPGFEFVQIILLLVALFYDMLIIPFEEMVMSDLAFYLIDFSLAFLPSILILAIGIIRVVHFSQIESYLCRCVKSIITQNSMNCRGQGLRNLIEDYTNSFWFYNVCRNCGAEAEKGAIFCTSCGSQLKIEPEQIANVEPKDRHQSLFKQEAAEKVVASSYPKTGAIKRVRGGIQTGSPNQAAQPKPLSSREAVPQGFIPFAPDEEWYYNSCPLCGTEVSKRAKKCSACLTPLLIPTDIMAKVLKSDAHRL